MYQYQQCKSKTLCQPADITTAYSKVGWLVQGLDFSWLCPGVGHSRHTPKLSTAARDWGTAGNLRSMLGWAQQAYSEWHRTNIVRLGASGGESLGLGAAGKFLDSAVVNHTLGLGNENFGAAILCDSAIRHCSGCSVCGSAWDGCGWVLWQCRDTLRLGTIGILCENCTETCQNPTTPL